MIEKLEQDIANLGEDKICAVVFYNMPDENGQQQVTPNKYIVSGKDYDTKVRQERYHYQAFIHETTLGKALMMFKDMTKRTN